MLAAEFGTGEVLWSLVWFTLFFILLGVAFIVFVPYLGVFVYLIARGHQLRAHGAEARLARDSAPDALLPATRIETP